MWKLNGPSKFIQNVADELQHGVSCIVDVPPFFPGDLIDVVEKEVSHAGRMHAVVVPPEILNTYSEFQITRNLFSFIGLRVDDVTDLNALVAGVTDYVFLYDGGCNDQMSWETLKCWMLRFLRQVQQLSESERPTFCITIPEHYSMIENEIGLKFASWKKVVRESDVRHYVDDIGEMFEANRFLGRVKKSIVVELGRTDLELVAHLCRFSLQELLSDEKLLQRFRQESPWMQDGNPFWERQALLHWDDLEESHSCFLDETDQMSEIRRRVWKAQVVSVFPFLESRRCEIVKNVRDLIPASFRSVTGEIKDVESLELGEIFYELNKLSRPPSNTAEVRNLRSIRHELAHLRPASYELLRKVSSF